jgi:polar amino acid transport system permease protein
MLKGSALVSIMGVGDITFGASLVRNATGQSAPVYTIILVMYFVLAFVLTRGMRVVERQAKAGIGQAPQKREGLRARMTGSQVNDFARSGATPGGGASQ